MIVIPKNELPQDIAFYKGQLSTNPVMESAARLASKKKRLLTNKALPPTKKVRQVKTVSSELARMTKRLRGLPMAGVATGAGPDEEDEGLVTSALEKWMNKMVKTTEAYPRRRQLPPTPPFTALQRTPTPVTIAKPGRRLVPSKIPTPKSPISHFPTPLTTPRSRPKRKLEEEEDNLLSSIIKGAVGGVRAKTTKGARAKTTRSPIVTRNSRKPYLKW